MEGSGSSAGGGGSGGGNGQRTSCDSCKRSKLKCIKLPGNDKCTRCTARNTECQVTLVSRKKREKKIHYLSAIEDRMKRMESAMNASGIAIDDADPDAAIPAVSAQSALEDKLSIFVISDDGAAGFVGPSSGFSLFSPQGLRWISEKTGNRNFEQIIMEVANSCEHVPVDGLHNSFRPLPESEREPLPPKDVANEYITAYFNSFNTSFPIYDKEIVMERFSRDYYMVNRQRDPAWYASLNVIFLIGRSITTHEKGGDGLCDKYFRNASSVFSDLVFNIPSLLAVQAMIGMVESLLYRFLQYTNHYRLFILQASEDPHPSYMLVGMASRLAQAIGLHRRLDGYGLKEKEIEQRRNVFWIVFGLEKGISLRAGRPSVFSDDDIGVELPPKGPKAYKDLTSADSVLGSFRSFATLALLESRVYDKLYSARSQTKSDLERLKWVGSLDRELQQWRDELPIEIRPEHPIKCLGKHLMDVIMIHFAYYNCLVAIHRGSSHHGSWIYSDKPTTVRDAKNIGLSPRVFESSAICLVAARQIVGLLNYYEGVDHTDIHNIGIVNMCNYYPLTASLTLFANILQNPTAEAALSDITLMNRVSRLLAHNFSSCNPKATIHLEIFKEMIRTAAQYVARARGEHPSTYLDASRLPQLPPDSYYSPDIPSSGVSPSGSGTDASSTDPLPRLEHCVSLPSQSTPNLPPPFSTPSPATPPNARTQPYAPPPYQPPTTQPTDLQQAPRYNEKNSLSGAGIIPRAYTPDYSTINANAPVDLTAFDFNNYAWQDNAGAFPGVEANGVGGDGVEVETYAAAGLDGGFGDGTDGSGFAPMVFQWDLADIWQGGSGFGK